MQGALKKTPLHALHGELGAKFGPFAGYDMPLFYPAGILSEHRQTRASAGLFDISHMLQVEIQGANAAAAVERLCPYPASEQAAGRARYSFFLNESGGIIDDLIVTRLAPDRFLLVCNAGSASKDLDHIRAQAASSGAVIKVRDRAFLALQGPESAAVLRDCDIGPLPEIFLDAHELPGDRFISRSGYTGEDGFEIALPVSEAEAFARKLLADPRVAIAGLGARDSLRLEAGLPLYGQDLSEEITPQEAGLSWAIPQSHRSGGPFVGANALAANFAAGRKRRRIGLVPEGAAPVRAHAEIRDSAGRLVGEITSGGFGPTVNRPVAMGLVAVDATFPVFAELRGRQAPLAEAKLPFVPHRYKN
jgi:aminomethyltransferase